MNTDVFITFSHTEQMFQVFQTIVETCLGKLTFVPVSTIVLTRQQRHNTVVHVPSQLVAWHELHANNNKPEGALVHHARLTVIYGSSVNLYYCSALRALLE